VWTDASEHCEADPALARKTLPQHCSDDCLRETARLPGPSRSLPGTFAQVFRLGVDWGRLVPYHPAQHGGGGHVQDKGALKRYVQIVRQVRRRGLRVMLTLFHHSLPKWALADGGRA